MPPIGAIIAAISSSIAAAFTWAAVKTFLVKLLVSFALSALSAAIARKKMKDQRPPGIATEVTTQGGNNPQSFIIGRYATAGNEVIPLNSHGKVGETPRAFLNYIIDVSDIPVEGLNRIVVNDDYAIISDVINPDYGRRLDGVAGGKGWIKFYDGTQTAADPMLLSKYGSDPDRPVTADMIGTGVAYAICTFQYDRELFNSPPRVMFEVNGIKLYDPRKDGSVGGTGAHRWNNRATWEFTTNPVVMIYNILRGITFPDGRKWGGEATAADLPLGNWFTAMNVCDEDINTDVGVQKRYRAGYEVKVDDTPADIIDEFLKACSGRLYESGGVWKIRAGGPSLPVKFITDEDLLISESTNYLPFASLGETYNAVHASYPDPSQLYAVKDAPPRYNATWEQDDGDRRLVAEVSLPSVPYPQQVQRLMRAWIEEERRFRRHNLFLPPDAAILEPLDTVAWTSAANGYTTKLFEVSTKSEEFMTMKQGLLLREVDSGDYNWVPEYEVPVEYPNLGLTLPPAQSVEGFGVNAFGIPDATGTQRRPAVRMSWTVAGLDDIAAIRFEIRLAADGVVVATPSTSNFSVGYFITEEGLMPATDYQIRAIYQTVGGRAVSWTGWIPVTTPALYITDGDFEEGVYKLFRDQDLYAIRDVALLPAAGLFVGEKVFLTTQSKLFQWTGTDWELTIAEPDSFIASDKIIANTITGGLLAASGIITSSAQIDDLVVTNAKIGNLAVDTLKIANASVTQMTFARRSGISLTTRNTWLNGFSAFSSDGYNIFSAATESGFVPGDNFLVDFSWGGTVAGFTSYPATGHTFIMLFRLCYDGRPLPTSLTDFEDVHANDFSVSSTPAARYSFQRARTIAGVTGFRQPIIVSQIEDLVIGGRISMAFQILPSFVPKNRPLYFRPEIMFNGASFPAAMDINSLTASIVRYRK